MRKLMIGVLAFGLGISLSFQVLAERDLYQDSSSVVSDQSAAARTAAAKEALERVVLRVAGVDRALKSPSVTSALAKPDRFVQGFAYQRAEQGFNIQLQFDQAAVDALLSRAGLPTWPTPRPQPLLWLAVDEGAGREMVKLGDLEVDALAFTDALGNDGFSIREPILDLEDRIALGVSKLWYGDQAAIVAASERYNSGYVLVGKFAKVSSGYVGSWQLITPKRTKTLNLTVTSLDEALAASTGFTRNLIAQETAISVSGTQVSGMQMVVSGVLSFADYTDAVNYVDNLTGISDASLARVDGDRLTFDIKLSGRLERVDSLIIAQGRLKKMPQDDLFTEQPTLHYYWLPQSTR